MATLFDFTGPPPPEKGFREKTEPRFALELTKEYLREV